MSNSVVEQIKERLQIAELIGEYVELKQAGKHLKAKSPFTNEKTPSFYVSPDRGMFYCFSSQKGGDIFTFIQEIEGVDFKGALKILAQKAGVELVPEDPKKRDERERGYALLEAAAVYFFSERENHKQVGAYLKKRGVEGRTIHTWRIGYARDAWRGLRGHLTKQGFSDDEMLRAGLIKKADGGKEPYDLFRDRIMFPIMDASGRVVAFSGRTLKTDADIPKYVNSPETALFQKSEILYGYDKAKQGIRQLGFSLIVEGQFDLIMSHQAGYSNTVAVSGTALTPFHIGLLTRLSSKAVLALDADSAGTNAVKRSAVPMLEAGMDVKVAKIPEGKDPADVVLEDPKVLKKIIGESSHVIEFLLTALKADSKDDRTYKLRVREEVLPLLNVIENRIDREHLIGVVSKITGISEDSIRFELKRLEEDKSHARAERPRDDTQQKKPVKKRQEMLKDHLRAFLEVLRGKNAWIKAALVELLNTIMDENTFADFTDAISEPRVQAVCFELEERIDDMSERELVEEVSHTLAQFAHLFAKEKLSQIMALQRKKEAEGDMVASIVLQKKAKPFETMLQKELTISKDK